MIHSSWFRRVMQFGVVGLFLLTGCTLPLRAPTQTTAPQAGKETPTPEVAPCPAVTGAEGYCRFKQSPLRVQFDYPSGWVFDADYLYGSGIDFFTHGLTTPEPREVDCPTCPETVVRFMLIFFRLVDPNTFSLADEVGSINNGRARSFDPEFSLLRYSWTTIDGFPAHKTIFRIDYQVPILQEEVYLLVGDQYYRFTLYLPEAERNREFGRGFDHIIQTIHIVIGP